MQVTLFLHLFTDASSVPVMREIRSELQRHFLLRLIHFTFDVKRPKNITFVFLVIKKNQKTNKQAQPNQ